MLPNNDAATVCTHRSSRVHHNRTPVSNEQHTGGESSPGTRRTAAPGRPHRAPKHHASVADRMSPPSPAWHIDRHDVLSGLLHDSRSTTRRGSRRHRRRSAGPARGHPPLCPSLSRIDRAANRSESCDTSANGPVTVRSDWRDVKVSRSADRSRAHTLHAGLRMFRRSARTLLYNFRQLSEMSH